MADQPTGFLFIGDPHLATRTPGFRKDDYAQTILNKLKWCLDIATAGGLVPVLLGDIFHFPRDNGNWLLVSLFELCRASRFPVLAVVGNHDCYENSLGPNDSLSVIQGGGAIQLLTPEQPWRGVVGGTELVLGGTPWNEALPRALPEALAQNATIGGKRLVLWVTHHDIAFAGYEDNARHRPLDIPGIDLVINGHIHRPLPESRCGQTYWLNPGNIARVSRSQSSRDRLPTVLRVIIESGQWSSECIEVPCAPYDEVFFDLPEAQTETVNQSVFVRGLAQLEAFRSATGAGLMHAYPVDTYTH